jgi:D-tyrosyl-tRNA(Tyr) deacylase
MLILLGIEVDDGPEDVAWLCCKIGRLRIFDDAEGVMNLAIREISGEIMVVSQFTLHASTKKGNRPSYIRAARPEQAIPLYEEFVRQIGFEAHCPVKTGEFGAMMEVCLINEGPVTVLMDSRHRE